MASRAWQARHRHFRFLGRGRPRLNPPPGRSNEIREAEQSEVRSGGGQKPIAARSPTRSLFASLRRFDRPTRGRWIHVSRSSCSSGGGGGTGLALSRSKGNASELSGPFPSTGTAKSNSWP